MKVAIYARVSSDRQAEKELSIPAQVKAIQQYCLEKEWTITHQFIEKGRSAKTDERPEFQKMIALAKRSNRPFDAVVVHKFDRFSRKRDDHVIYKAFLNQHGVKVISVTEQTQSETPQDVLLEGMLEVISEFFNANLAVEVRKGMTQNAKQGYNNGGTPPYGYRTEHLALGHQKTKAVWVLGPREEIETIRWMFHQYAYENMGYKKIASMLNDQGIPTQKGGKWSATTVRAMIHNESYLGRKIWNKQDYQTKGNKWRDRSEWVITENAHPAIVSEELFNRCQQKAKERHNGGGVVHRESPVKKSSPFWLRGMFCCEKCGSRMVGNSTATTKKYGGQRYYVCGGYMRKGKEFCPYVSWRKERIEKIVTNKLRSVLLRLTFDNQLEEEIRKYHSDVNRHIWTEKANLESEVAYLDRRISQLEEELKSGVGKVYYVDMLEDLKGELVVKQGELEKIRDAYSELDLSEETLKLLIHDIRVMIAMLDDEVQNPQLMNEYVKKFVSEVTVHRETKNLYMRVELRSEQQVLYQKVIVAASE